jgi:hypothetical protein
LDVDVDAKAKGPKFGSKGDVDVDLKAKGPKYGGKGDVDVDAKLKHKGDHDVDVDGKTKGGSLKVFPILKTVPDCIWVVCRRYCLRFSVLVFADDVICDSVSGQLCALWCVEKHACKNLILREHS